MKASTLVMLFFSVVESVAEVIAIKVMLVCGQVWN